MTSRFLSPYAGTLLPLVTGLVAIVLGWAALADGVLVGGHPWASAAVAVTTWVLAGASWLRCRGWRAAPVHAVTWAAPVAVLAAPAAAGWLSADGLVLWTPAVTVLAVSVAMVALAGRRPSDDRPTAQLAGWGAGRPRAASARAATAATSPPASIRSSSPSAT